MKTLLRAIVAVTEITVGLSPAFANVEDIRQEEGVPVYIQSSFSNEIVSNLIANISASEISDIEKRGQRTTTFWTGDLDSFLARVEKNRLDNRTPSEPGDSDLGQSSDFLEFDSRGMPSTAWSVENSREFYFEHNPSDSLSITTMEEIDNTVRSDPSIILWLWAGDRHSVLSLPGTKADNCGISGRVDATSCSDYALKSWDDPTNHTPQHLEINELGDDETTWQSIEQ